jgi:hypothetical protein
MNDFIKENFNKYFPYFVTFLAGILVGGLFLSKVLF